MNNKKIGDGGIHHVALRVRNFEKSLQFYSQVLGFEERVRWNESPNRIALLDMGNRSYLELFEAFTRPNEKEDAFWHLAIRVNDVDSVFKMCREAGCESHVEPKSLNNLGGTKINVRLAFVKGPDGELVEFFQSEEL
jgi:glyoxylase I family protein